ncbi:hypothetical protein [uncultured Sphingomonas sp.]|uniref:hypothetical protein n=1 Tax=uncultured Sphingomonas sp. TaxID=158754 RepID=UPI0025D0B28B|nr:hypothetical protein [uncultured Sphingomonas sp.]
MTTRFAIDGDAACIAMRASLLWVLGSMVASAAVSVAGGPIAVRPATRRPTAAAIGVMPGRSLHHLARVVLILLAAPLAFRPTREELPS